MESGRVMPDTVGDADGAAGSAVDVLEGSGVGDKTGTGVAVRGGMLVAVTPGPGAEGVAASRVMVGSGESPLQPVRSRKTAIMRTQIRRMRNL